MQPDGDGAYEESAREKVFEKEEKGVQEDHSAQARVDSVEGGGYRLGIGECLRQGRAGTTGETAHSSARLEGRSACM